jgi:hypothetical protein
MSGKCGMVLQWNDVQAFMRANLRGWTETQEIQDDRRLSLARNGLARHLRGRRELECAKLGASRKG